MLDDLATDDMTLLMAPLPWMRAAQYRDHDGLRCCLQAMLHPDPTGYSDDPRARGWRSGLAGLEADHQDLLAAIGDEADPPPA